VVRWVERNGGQVPLWTEEEWCTKLPSWWTRHCGCRRECSLDSGLADALFEMHPMYLKWLHRYGHAVIDGWVLKRKTRNTVAIFPWPKHIFRPWWD